MVMERGRASVACRVSATTTVNENVPGFSGVPLINPELFIARPSGSVPAEMLQE
jgi:hypothetical protein